MRSTELYCTKRPQQNGFRWWSFYPNPRTVCYAGAENGVFHVRVVEDPHGDYVGWWELGRQEIPRFTLVYPNRMLLDMCFPYGMEAEEEHGRGHCLAVRIELIKQVDTTQWD